MGRKAGRGHPQVNDWSVGFRLVGTSLPGAPQQTPQLVHGPLQPLQPLGRTQPEAEPCLATAMALVSAVECTRLIIARWFSSVMHRCV